MSTPLDKSSGSKSLSTVQAIVLAGVIWGVLALLFFLLFSVSEPGKEQPKWYSIGTYVFEMVAYLSAAVLCFRNWRSYQIASGRNVWLAFGLGMSFYFIGQGIFGYIELVQNENPDISIADVFFSLNYVCLVLGMVRAVFSKRLSLEVWQWATVGAIGIFGIGLAAWLSLPTFQSAQLLTPPVGDSWLMPVAVAQSPPTKQSPLASPTGKASPATPAAKTAPAVSPVSPTGKASPATPAAKTVPASPETPDAKVPVPTTPAPPSPSPEGAKERSVLKTTINIFYLVADVMLLILATMLLLAFWGGRFSMSWRMIAAAAFCLYVSDMYYKVSILDPNYQSGSLMEVGWVFSGILFGMGAALEYDVSTRSRRGSGRRRAAG